MSDAIKKALSQSPVTSGSSHANLNGNSEEGLFFSTVASTAQFFGAEFTRIIIQCEGGDAFKVLAQYCSPDSKLNLPPPFTILKSSATHCLREVFRHKKRKMTSLKEYTRGVTVVPQTDATVVSIPVLWKGGIVGVFEAIFAGKEIERDKLEAMVVL